MSTQSVLTFKAKQIVSRSKYTAIHSDDSVTWSSLRLLADTLNCNGAHDQALAIQESGTGVERQSRFGGWLDP